MFDATNLNSAQDEQSYVPMNGLIVPREIIEQIFSYLPPEDLLNKSLVARLWNQISQNIVLWQGLIDQHFPSLSKSRLFYSNPKALFIKEYDQYARKIVNPADRTQQHPAYSLIKPFLLSSLRGNLQAIEASELTASQKELLYTIALANRHKKALVHLSQASRAYALMLAVANSDVIAVRMIFSEAADLTTEDKNKALDLAVQNKHLNISSAIIENLGQALTDAEKKAKLDLVAQEGYLALYEAASRGDEDAVEASLASGISPNYLYPYKIDIALVKAVEANNENIVRQLVKAGADLNCIGKYGEKSALHCAVVSKLPKMVQVLIELGAEVNLPGGSNVHKPLFILNELLVSDNVAMLEVMVEHISDLEAFFDASITDYKEEIFKWLLVNRKELSLEKANEYGTTRFESVMIAGEPGMRQALIDTKPNWNQKTRHGVTRLMASMFNFTDAQMQQILAQNPDLNLQDSKGYTFLMCLVINNKKEWVKMVLDQTPKPDLTLTDADGVTALQWAQARGYEEIAQMLTNAMTCNEDDALLAAAPRAITPMNDLEKQRVAAIVERQEAQAKQEAENAFASLMKDFSNIPGLGKEEIEAMMNEMKSNYQQELKKLNNK